MISAARAHESWKAFVQAEINALNKLNELLSSPPQHLLVRRDPQRELVSIQLQFRSNQGFFLRYTDHPRFLYLGKASTMLR